MRRSAVTFCPLGMIRLSHSGTHHSCGYSHSTRTKANNQDTRYICKYPNWQHRLGSVDDKPKLDKNTERTRRWEGGYVGRAVERGSAGSG